MRPRGRPESAGLAKAIPFDGAALPDEIAAPPHGLRVLRGVDRAADTLVVGALVGELLLVLANLFARVVFQHSFLWSDEIARLALSILAFVGGAIAYRRREHTSVRMLLRLLPKRIEPVGLALADTIVLFVATLTTILAGQYIAQSGGEHTPVLHLPAATLALPLPVGMGLIALHAAIHLWEAHGRIALQVGGGLAACLALGAAAQDLWLPLLDGDGAIGAALALFGATILGGVPVGFALLAATSAYLWASDSAPLTVVPQTIVDGTGNYILLAVPFFVLAGLVMERGGISLRLIRFIETLVGHRRGGMLQVTVVSMYVVSGLSGSKSADVAAVGTVMRDRLAESDLEAEGTAVLAASAIMGETVPPSIAMLIVGSITNVSVAGMFVGGLVPAAVMAACLMGLIHVRARRADAPRRPRATWGAIAAAGRGAILPVLMPAMLLAGILFGIATPTEVAALSVVYGLALAVLVYRTIDLPALLRTALDTAALTGVLLFIFAAAAGFSWVLTVAYLPQRLVELLGTFGGSGAVFMIGSIVLLVVVGVLLEGLPSLNVLAPLLLPIAVKLGFSGLHYALVLIIAMGIGGFMPVAGVGFYICCAVMRCDLETASRAMVPYLIVTVLGLLAVAFLPGLSLALPTYFGLH